MRQNSFIFKNKSVKDVWSRKRNRFKTDSSGGGDPGPGSEQFAFKIGIPDFENWSFGGLDRLVQEPVEMDFRVSSQIFPFLLVNSTVTSINN